MNGVSVGPTARRSMLLGARRDHGASDSTANTLLPAYSELITRVGVARVMSRTNGSVRRLVSRRIPMACSSKQVRSAEGCRVPVSSDLDGHGECGDRPGGVTAWTRISGRFPESPASVGRIMVSRSAWSRSPRPPRPRSSPDAESGPPLLPCLLVHESGRRSRTRPTRRCRGTRRSERAELAYPGPPDGIAGELRRRGIAVHTGRQRGVRFRRPVRGRPRRRRSDAGSGQRGCVGRADSRAGAGHARPGCRRGRGRRFRGVRVLWRMSRLDRDGVLRRDRHRTAIGPMTEPATVVYAALKALALARDRDHVAPARRPPAAAPAGLMTRSVG